MNILCAGAIRAQQDAEAGLSEPVCQCERVKAEKPAAIPVATPRTVVGVYELRPESPKARTGAGEEVVNQVRQKWTLGTLIAGLASATCGFLVCRK